MRMWQLILLLHLINRCSGFLTAKMTKYKRETNTTSYSHNNYTTFLYDQNKTFTVQFVEVTAIDCYEVKSNTDGEIKMWIEAKPQLSSQYKLCT